MRQCDVVTLPPSEAVARRWLIVVGAAAVVAGAVVPVVGGLAPLLAVRAVPAAAFLAAVVVVWSSGGSREIGLRLLGCCVSIAAINFTLWPGEAAAFLRQATGGYAPFGAFLIHLLLTYPSGRISSRLDRVVVVGAYSLAAVYSAQQLVIGDAQGQRFCGAFACPTVPVLIHSDVLARFTPLVVTGVYGVLIMATLALLVRRALTGPAARRAQQRRVLASALAGGALGLFQMVWRNVSLDGLAWLNVVVSLASVLGAAVVPIVLVLMGLRARLVAFGLGDLLTSRGDGEQATLARLSALLPQVLADPSARLELTPARARDDDPTITRVLVGDPPVTLVYSTDPAPDARLLRATMDAIALIADNVRLQEQLEEQVAELAGSRARITAAADAERSRIERDLHDGAQQHLVATALNVHLARESVRSDPAAAEALLAQVEERLQSTLGEIRDLARHINPTALSDYGLGPAVDALREQVPLQVSVVDDLPARLPEAVERAGYFVVCEALVNVLKHSGTEQAQVHLAVDSDRDVIVRVRDHGRGGADPARGSGLRGLADRVSAAGGHLRVESSPLAGTTLTAYFPHAATP